MKAKGILVAICATWLAASTFAMPRMQDNDSHYQYNQRDDQRRQGDQRDNDDRYRDDAARSFTNHDRDVLRNWYDNHSEQFELHGDRDRWNAQQIDNHLQVGRTFDEDFRRSSQLVPYNLEQRLDPLPDGWNYMIVGDNAVIVDRDDTVRDVYHFDQFSDRDREAIQDWNREHPNALNQFLGAFGVRVQNGDLDQRLQVGNVVDQDLQNDARPAPDDLARQLSVPPRGWRYVIIADRLCLVDRDWRIHESFHFQHG